MDQHEKALKIFVLSLKVEMPATHDGNYLDTAVVLQKKRVYTISWVAPKKH